jgi:hypothetical protein
MPATKSAAAKILRNITAAGFYGRQIHEHFILTVSVHNPFGGAGQQGRETELRTMCNATGLAVAETASGCFTLTYGEPRMMVPPQRRP